MANLLHGHYSRTVKEYILLNELGLFTLIYYTEKKYVDFVEKNCQPGHRYLKYNSKIIKEDFLMVFRLPDLFYKASSTNFLNGAK